MNLWLCLVWGTQVSKSPICNFIWPSNILFLKHVLSAGNYKVILIQTHNIMYNDHHIGHNTYIGHHICIWLSSQCFWCKHMFFFSVSWKICGLFITYNTVYYVLSCILMFGIKLSDLLCWLIRSFVQVLCVLCYTSNQNIWQTKITIVWCLHTRSRGSEHKEMPPDMHVVHDPPQ